MAKCTLLPPVIVAVDGSLLVADVFVPKISISFVVGGSEGFFVHASRATNVKWRRTDGNLKIA